MEGLATRIGLRIWVVAVLVFLFLPIVTIVVFAFDKSNIETFPIHHFTLHWFSVAWHDQQMREALYLSLKAAVLATAISLVLGSLAAFGVHRFRFFGREAVSFLLILPLSLPGIITGIALNSAFAFVNVNLGLLTIVIGHATFCIVVVYNNVIARLRRVSNTLYEASADLGAHGWQTFRYVSVPMLSTALISGALLAFALSFDEVIVTTFTAGAQNTLPLWIFGAIRLGQTLPEVNVVVTFVVLLTLIPVFIAAKLTGGGGVTRGSAAQTRGAGEARL
jgi:putative spermidine/putrescine transport system permease protein